jgi:hypothetical protein
MNGWMGMLQTSHVRADERIAGPGGSNNIGANASPSNGPTHIPDASQAPKQRYYPYHVLNRTGHALHVKVCLFKLLTFLSI